VAFVKKITDYENDYANTDNTKEIYHTLFEN